MCDTLVEQVVPTRFSAKVVTLRCGSTSIYGDRLLCEQCSKTVPNPPAHLCEDAGEADFEPFRWEEV